jgi:hypothetical protein
MITFAESGHVSGVTFDGKKRLEKGSLMPRIVYDSTSYSPGKFDITVLKDGDRGVSSVKLAGEIIMDDVDGTIPGHVEYVCTLIEGLPHLFVECDITYPETPLNDIFKLDQPALTRKYDRDWEEVAPIELLMSQSASRSKPFRVLKRNYLGVESSYKIDYFKHHRKNRNLDNVNNHITAEYVGVVGGGKGMAVAMDTSLLANFAFAPLKVTSNFRGTEFNLSINPFGTYFGDQYYHPTWGNRQGWRMAQYSGAHYQTGAPTFNGYSSKFSLMIAFFDGEELPVNIKNDLVAFAYPPVIVTGKNLQHMKKSARKILPPAGFIAAYTDNGAYFHWEKRKGEDIKKYIIRCGTEPGSYKWKFEQEGSQSTLLVKELSEGKKFTEDIEYFAVISSVTNDYKESKPSGEISFEAVPVPEGKDKKDLPIHLQLKVLWYSLKSLID